MAKTITVGCKLPHGIVLEHPMNPLVTVTLAGLNALTIIGAQYASTDVDGDFYEQWLAVNAEFPAVKSGAIFAAKNNADVAALAKEYEKNKTGFEPMDPAANGVKPADSKE